MNIKTLSKQESVNHWNAASQTWKERAIQTTGTLKATHLLGAGKLCQNFANLYTCKEWQRDFNYLQKTVLGFLLKETHKMELSLWKTRCWNLKWWVPGYSIFEIWCFHPLLCFLGPVRVSLALSSRHSCRFLSCTWYNTSQGSSACSTVLATPLMQPCPQNTPYAWWLDRMVLNSPVPSWPDVMAFSSLF